jgi:hypothetical protein
MGDNFFRVAKGLQGGPMRDYVLPRSHHESDLLTGAKAS